MIYSMILYVTTEVTLKYFNKTLMLQQKISDTKELKFQYSFK